MFFTLSGITISSIFAIFANAKGPMFSIPYGMSMVIKLEHKLNASIPRCLMVDGKLTDFRL